MPKLTEKRPKRSPILRFLVKYAAVLANLLCVTCYLAALLAMVVPPDKFFGATLFADFGLAYPILLLINVGFVLFWLVTRKWKIALLSLVPLACSYSAILQTFSIPNKPSEQPGREIKLLTYNVMRFGEERKFRQIADLIEKSDADIVCLQEYGFYQRKGDLNEEKIRDRLQKKYPYQHRWYKTQSSRFWWGVATFSKHPIVNKQTIDYESRFNVSIYSDIKIGEKTVRVFNNHLESNKLTAKDLPKKIDQENLQEVAQKMSHKLGNALCIRAKQARIVRREIDQSPYPTIVCGDFNDVPISYAYHTIARHHRDACTTTSWGYNYTFYERNLLFKIDHILIDQTHFEPVNSHIEKVNFSDHYPIFATIKMFD